MSNVRQLTSSRKRAEKEVPGLKPVAHDQVFAAEHAETKGGDKIVETHAADRWDAVNGEALHRIDHNWKELKEKTERAAKAEQKALQARDQHPRHISMSTLRTGDHDIEPVRDVPFGQWALQDKVTTLLAALMALVLLGLGAVNVASTILASGTPAFLDHPWMAWMFGGLVPAIAMLIKFGYGMFDHRKAQKQYAWAVYSSGAAAALAWVVLFALSYEGAAAGIDWDSLGDSGSGHIASALTVTQIATEVLAGAALGIVISNSFANYSASYITENAAWTNADRTHAACRAELDTLRANLAQIEGARERMLAARRVYVGEAVAHWHALHIGRGAH